MKDNGHMMVGEVASQLMDKADIATLESVLSAPELPGGDAGGNAYAFKTPCLASNLHALWDMAGGDNGEEQRHRNVILDAYSYANNVVYRDLDLKFDANKKVPCPSKSYFEWAVIDLSLELDVTSLSEEAANVVKFRIAKGGQSLAVILMQFTKQLRVLEFVK
ncbi:hypothetical protein PybrP1_010041 [[Pythium] brassicae (nom. inval.)]|nr:hypothetical protein PybrP1_010041 [[Pythium] brassicae (nom. inval.)]